MEEIQHLLDVLDRLLGPDGCPWDREQTFESLRTEILEEVYELVDAIDAKDDHKILEELADLLFTALFLCKMGENDKKFSVAQVATFAAEKYIRRHPHIFGNATIDSIDELYVQWDAIKKKEKGKETRTSKLDDIPKSMQGLLRAQEVAKKFRKAKYPQELLPSQKASDTDLAEQIYLIVQQADATKIDVAAAFNKLLKQKESHFRLWE